MVLEDDDVAVAVLLADKLDFTVAGGHHLGARRCGKVHAFVLRPVVVQRMVTPAEARRHARELHGRAQERPLHAAPVEGVVRALLAAFRCVPERLVQLVVVDQLDRDHAAVAHKRAVAKARFVDDAEAVAAGDVVVEVDHAGEDREHLLDDLVGHVGSVHGLEETAVGDGAGQHLVVQLVLHRLHAGLVDRIGRVARAFDHQLAGGVCVTAEVGLQRHQQVVLVDLGLHRLAGIEVEQAARGGVAADKGLRIGVVHAKPLEQAANGVATLHALFAHKGSVGFGKLFELRA